MNPWVQYQPDQRREKLFHDIKLRDGEIVEHCWPNATAWYPMHPDKPSKHHRVADYRVVEIRVSDTPMNPDER